MSKRDDGGPAFPCVEYANEEGRLVPAGSSNGVSVRDYFAAKAMAAIVANNGLVDHKSAHDDSTVDDSIRSVKEESDDLLYMSECRVAYQVADAMLEARK